MSSASLLADPRPVIMGILNVTPDSFSDGGRFVDHQVAIDHGLSMAAHGAQIVDVGGESTRPGAEPVTETEQLRRILPVIDGLRSQTGGSIGISVDARLASVAGHALDAGADMINDVSAGADARMFALAAARDLPICLMHMRGTPADMQRSPDYDDVVDEVSAYLTARARAAIEHGVAEYRIVLDPGIGFGKLRGHNLALLNALDRLVATGFSVMVGTSRKRLLQDICRETRADRLVGATCATTALAVAHGVKVLRVHDVQANRQAADVAWALREAMHRGAGKQAPA